MKQELKDRYLHLYWDFMNKAAKPHYGVDVFPAWKTDAPGAEEAFTTWVKENLGEMPVGLGLGLLDRSVGFQPDNIGWMTHSEHSPPPGHYDPSRYGGSDETDH